MNESINQSINQSINEGTYMFAAHSENMRNRVEFVMEAVLMADFDHRNVMWLIAIVIDDEMKPHVLLPLMENGDLRSFIAKPNNVSE